MTEFGGIDKSSIKMSLHTTAPQDASGQTIEPQHVSWGSAEPVTVKSVWIGDEVFVRPDWDAYTRGYEAGASDEEKKWSQPSMYDEGRWAERKRIRDEVLAYYAVAPKAAEPLLRIIDGGK